MASRFGADPAVVGREFVVAQSKGGRSPAHLRVIGVLPDRTGPPLPDNALATDVWALAAPTMLANARAEVFMGVGRLRPGRTVAQAQAALGAAMSRLAPAHRQFRGRAAALASFVDIVEGPARRTLGLLTAALAFVFLLACVNLAVFMMAEGSRRRREIAIRTALGAGRARLWAELASEKMALTALAVLAGAGMAEGMLRLLTLWLPAAGLGVALSTPPPLEFGVLVAFAAVMLVAALLWSALLVYSAEVRRGPRALANGSGLGYAAASDSSHRAGQWRLALLAGQAALAVCLFAAAALAARTFALLSRADLGPEPARTSLLQIAPSNNQALADDNHARALDAEVLARLARMPGVRAVALAGEFPPIGYPSTFVRQGDAPGTHRGDIPPMSVTPAYFGMMGIPVLYGRSFGPEDHAGSEPVAVITLPMARANWDRPQDAVGSSIALDSQYKNPVRVVGVVGDFTGYWSEHPAAMAYLPEAQSPLGYATAIVRTVGTPGALAVSARAALQAMPTALDLEDGLTMQANWDRTLTQPQARTAGMMLLALLALGLGLQGIYAVSAATVEARGHEFAVRSALGAPPHGLAWSATRGLALAIALGAAAGGVGSLALQPLLAHWLGHVTVPPALPLAAAAALLVLTAAAGTYWPVRAAARTNPADALRRA